jgi:REP element-mobilizing transposase RayT
MRPLRIEFSGAWYHIINRGINHQTIFNTNEHRKFFLSLLDDITNKFYVEIHAYCLMDNHYHILLKITVPNLSKVMQYFNGVYTQYFNRSIGRDGPLFRGRYKAILVDADSYLLQLSRYIHLNPVDANICATPLYPWSSYQFYIQSINKPKWLHCEMILQLISGKNVHASYADFVSDGLDNEISDFYCKKYLPVIIGNDSFIKKHIKLINDKIKEVCGSDIKRCQEFPNIEMIMDAVINYFEVDSQSMLSSMTGKINIPKMMLIFLSKQLGQLSYQKIAEHLGLKPTSVSSSMKRFNQMKCNNHQIEEGIHTLTNIILLSFEKLPLK